MRKHIGTSQTRLASAKRRVAAFLDQISELKASSFPHAGGMDALTKIEDACLKRKRWLDIPFDKNEDLIDETCLNVASFISVYTAVLGFILRSTNVRNPFELHFALTKLVKLAIDDDVQVLISSEWNFVPFTYPMSLDILPDFVLIGTPAPESGNVLVVPLSGHEIGHSAWRSYDFENKFGTRVTAEVDAALKRSSDIERRLLEAFGKDPLIRDTLVDRCGQSSLMQLEEIFCDLFGIYIFGAGYLFAFDYFLAPGNPDCKLHYPSDGRRITILADAANNLSIPFDDALVQRWYGAKYHKSDGDMGVIVDDVVDIIVPEVREALFNELRKRTIAPPDNGVILKILSSFERREPYSNKARLAEIVTAGWLYLSKNNGLSDPGQRDEYKALNDLILKSIEVAEFLERISDGA